MAPKVLFIYNDPTAPEALLGEVFAEQGFDIDTFEVVSSAQVDQPAVQVEFPDPADYDVVVPLGSRWSVYDEQRAWIRTEMQLTLDADAAGVGVLGICFGGQLLAQAHGGSVSRSPNPEIGWFDVESSATGLVPAGRWFEWHFDRWTPPPGAVEIARSQRSSQAFVIGRTLALQFHPELDSALLENWLVDGTHEVIAEGVSPDELRSATTFFQDDAAVRLRTLVSGFLSQVARRPTQSPLADSAFVGGQVLGGRDPGVFG